MSFTWPKVDAWIDLDAYMENKHLTGEVSQWTKVMRDVYATKEESGFISRNGSTTAPSSWCSLMRRTFRAGT